MTRDPEANESETRADTREKTLQSRMMSEMRQHLIRMNREKMIERGALTDKEAVLLGKVSMGFGERKG